MDQRTIQILFALLRSAICGTKLTEQERKLYSPDLLEDLQKTAARQDVAHLLAFALGQNDLIAKENSDVEKHILRAVFRHEQIKYEYESVCAALEDAQIPFLPLKGSVLRDYYPEAWMRTSCDIDILVHREDLEKTVSYLSSRLQYAEKERATHDVSFISPLGICVEIHFDLVEEGRANDAIKVLGAVWDSAVLREDSEYCYRMNDDFFYFYHVAHMAKHFENGGCGIRPFMDLWILDHMKDADVSARDARLSEGRLLKFANVSRKLSRVWFGGEEADALSLQMQNFLLHGGVYGTADNRVALGQKKMGGRVGYMLSRIFIPYEKLKRYYPVLEKHRWLMPVMQVRRWFTLFDPSVAKMARREMSANQKLDKTKSEQMNTFLEGIGL